MQTLLIASLLAIATGTDQNPIPGTSGSPAVARQMVVTLDDLPAQRAPALAGERLEALTADLLRVLKRRGVPAIGFVNEEKLYAEGRPEPARVALLEQWLDAGLELGNHTFSHPDLHQVSLDEFQADILRGEQITRPLAAGRGVPWRFFRHPFLHTGLDLETKRAVEDFLGRHGYRIAPVTIDNSEWIFARAFDHALERGDEEIQQKLGREYLEYMLAMVRYYEAQSRGLFEREIPQILLLHANDLNARYLEPLLEALKERGYRFVDLETALRDPAFRSEDTYVGPGGITWLHRWALTRGLESEFFQGEPTTAQWVQELAGFEE